jgi:hypothetical protein
MCVSDCFVLMDPHDTLKTMLSAGQRHSINVNTLTMLPLKLIVLSLKYVSKKALWETQFGEDFVDWTLVDGLTHKNILGGCAEWLGLLSFCEWETLGKHEGVIQRQHTPLHGLKSHLRGCNLDTGGKDAWTVACRAFLLLLVQGLPGLHVIELLTCGVFKRNTHDGCMQLLIKQVRQGRLNGPEGLADTHACPGGPPVHPGRVRADRAVHTGSLRGGRERAGADAGAAAGRRE